MNKPTLCDRCNNAPFCLLNFDGKPCRKVRTVEPTNYDFLISKTPEELAVWLSAIMDCSKCVCEIPCAKEITTKFCKDVLRDWLKAPASTEGER